MAALTPPPIREPDFSSPIWKKWFSDIAKKMATIIESPTVDNFASLDANGTIQDSGYDGTSFVPIAQATPYAILGDTTAGRKLRQIQLLLEDGTNVATLKVTVSSLWNGDAIGVTDNVAKNATTGDFTLNLAGSQIDINTSGLTGDCVMAQGSLSQNVSGTALCDNIYNSGTGIRLIATNATTGAALDMTTLVNTGTMTFNILYLTSA